MLRTIGGEQRRLVWGKHHLKIWALAIFLPPHPYLALFALALYVPRLFCWLGLRKLREGKGRRRNQTQHRGDKGLKECPDRSYQTRKLGTAKRQRLFRGVGRMSLRPSLSALLLLLLLPCNCTALSITVSLASLHPFPAQEEKLRLVRPPRRGTSLSALNLISAASCTQSFHHRIHGCGCGCSPPPRRPHSWPCGAHLECSRWSRLPRTLCSSPGMSYQKVIGQGSIAICKGWPP